MEISCHFRARSHSHSSNLSEYLALLAIIGFGVALRLWSPGMRSDFWYDETFSYIVACKPFRAMMHSLVLGGDANPPLYTFILHFWLKLGRSDITARLLSILFGAAAIPVMYLLGKKLTGKKVALLSALLFASSEPAINYSAEARSYSIVLFLSLCTTYVLISIICEAAFKAQGRNLTARFAAYSALAALTIYAHWFGLLVLAAQSSSILIYRRTVRRVARHYAWSLAAIVSACVPLIKLLRNEIVLRRGTGGYLWPGRPHLHTLYSLASFLVGGQALLVLVFVAVILAYRSAHRDPPASQWGRERLRARHAIFLGNYLLAPPIIVFAISTVLAHYTFFVFRYFLPFLASVPILIGAAVTRLEKKVAIAVISAFVLTPVVRSLEYHRGPDPPLNRLASAPPLINKLGLKSPVSPYSAAASALSASCSADAVVVHLSPMSFFPLLHYSDAACSNQKILWRQGPGLNRVRLNLRSGMLKPDDLLRAAGLYRYAEIYVVIDPLDDGDDIENTATSIRTDPAFTLESEKQFDGLRLQHYIVKRPPE